MNNIMTIHEVRKNIDSVYNIIEDVNAHVMSNSCCLDSHDLDALRRAWEYLRELKASKWTNQLL